MPDDVVTENGTGKSYPAGIHLALKTVGSTNGAAVSVYDAEKTPEDSVLPVENIATATDLYYDISGLNGKTVVITNTSEASSGVIISITNIILGGR